MKIVHLPVDLGGHASGLAAAQRALGHDAVAYSLSWSDFGFNGDVSLDLPQGTRHRLFRREISRLRLLRHTLAHADVIHCHFGCTALSVRPFPVRDPDNPNQMGETFRLAYARLLWLKDLALWGAFGKTVAITFYGDDIRSIEASVRRNPYSHLGLPEVAERLSARKEWHPKFLAAIDRRVRLIYAANPDLLETLPARARWIGYSHCDIAQTTMRPWPSNDGPLRLLHMPSNRAVKGTDFLLQAVARLQAEGVPLALTLVENEPNVDAIARLADHHVLVDQLRVGWYGGVAVEAMAAGRPVVAYILPRDAALTPPQFAADLPIIVADPSTIAKVLLELAVMKRADLEKVGRNSQLFVKRWHDPICIAAQTIEDYARVQSENRRP